MLTTETEVSKIFINHTEGGEYSPLKIPNKNEVSAVRLDKDGKQRLYTYNLNNCSIICFNFTMVIFDTVLKPHQISLDGHTDKNIIFKIITYYITISF